MRSSRILLSSLLGTTWIAMGAGCGSSAAGSLFDAGTRQDGSTPGTTSDATTGGGDDGPTLILGGDGGVPASGPLVLSPANQAIDVNFGAGTPTVAFTATIGGRIVNASFAVDRGEIGSIDAASGVLTPGGTVGGIATVTATYGSQTASSALTVHLHQADNGGATPTGDAGTTADGGGAGGSGGAGGVGGEGTGGPVDATTQGVLSGPAVADPGLAWVYPYDQTLWPRGTLAPLLQWTAPRSYDGVYIHLEEAAFEYRGYFAKTAANFAHHPVPQAAWDALSYSNQGEDVKVTLVFAAGGQAYGPITQTWKMVHGTLKGTVYYNSYGTNLAHNYCCTTSNQPFGGATLAIRHGSTDPVLVAGNDNECRVCHSVSADGSRLVTQRGDKYTWSATYDLKNANSQTALMPDDGRFGWPALSPDGTLLLSDGANMLGAGWNADAQLFALPSGTPVASTGIPAGLRAASPVFSPDGKHVAFNFAAGPNADGKSLAMMDYDPATQTFSNLQVLYTPTRGTVVWPSFLPASDAVLFELETVYNGRDWGGTRSGCDSAAACSNSGTQAELWWVDVATKNAVRLDNLNGKGYLPTLAATQHTDDSIVNYEPTVSPLPSGGYAWVVFTSRRLYGNVATVNPYWSDPRFHDLGATPTTKKLWVAPIDLNAKAGTDPSHPAFYLPGQELLAGNSRGYWVVDPCAPNDSGCQSGDECCGGYCKKVDGGSVCSDQPPACAQEFDHCASTSDCCGAGSGFTCINGRCAQPNLQ